MAERFAVVVDRFPEDPSGPAPHTLRALRALDPALSLGDVKAVAQGAAPHLPCVLAEGLDADWAKDVVDALREQGGAARVAPSRHPLPLVARPPRG